MRLCLLSLVDANHVSGGVTECAVTFSVRLLHGFLNHFSATRPEALERRVKVVDAENHAVQVAFSQELGDRFGVGLADTREAVALHENYFRTTVACYEAEPTESVHGDVRVDTEPHEVTVENECFVLVVDGDEAVGKGDVCDLIR